MTPEVKDCLLPILLPFLPFLKGYDTCEIIREAKALILYYGYTIVEGRQEKITAKK